jgi:3-oxoadipate enol-lactonase
MVKDRTTAGAAAPPTMSCVVQVAEARAADGVRLALAVDGAGPPLLLIPGLGATRRVFAPLVPPLAARYRVITYDPRGVGDSEAGDAQLTIRLLAEDATAILDAVGSDRAAVLGASMGGVVAQQFALDHASRVQCLILAATSPGGAKAIPPDPRVTAALMGRGGRTPEEAYRIACTVLYSPHFQRTHPEFIDEQVRIRAAHPVSARVFSAQLRALEQADDIFGRLGALNAPALVMHGSADAVTPMENAELLASLIPGARRRWFEDCGHLFFHERPQESARVADEFLRACAQEPASG